MKKSFCVLVCIAMQSLYAMELPLLDITKRVVTSNPVIVDKIEKIERMNSGVIE